MAIETLDDIVSELADQLEIYGGCDQPHDCQECTCRQGWEASMKARIMDAVEVEQRLQAFDFERDSSGDGDTLCGQLGRPHRMRRQGPMKTFCIYPGCNALC